MKSSQCGLGLACLFLTLAVGLGIAQDKDKDKKKDEPRPTLSEEEQKVLDLTNAERAREKLPPLTINPKLLKAARAYSEVMAKLDKVDHEVDGTKPRQRAEKAGYEGEYVGENVGYTFGGLGAKAMVKWWMESKLHRENILRKEFTEIGLGAFKNKDGKIYYTQLFGAPFKD